jgi:CRISPR/Cas system-associated endonuclease Cas3-HD
MSKRRILETIEGSQELVVEAVNITTMEDVITEEKKGLEKISQDKREEDMKKKKSLLHPSVKRSEDRGVPVEKTDILKMMTDRDDG